jgi:hypothetical protein
VQPNEITEVLNRPISQELLARDVTRLAYVAKDGVRASRLIGDRSRSGATARLGTALPLVPADWHTASWKCTIARASARHTQGRRGIRWSRSRPATTPTTYSTTVTTFRRLASSPGQRQTREGSARVYG